MATTAGSWRPQAALAILQQRARMLTGIRAFFSERNVLEVETPLISHAAATDLHLASVACRVRGERCYLNTSPEFAMKRLLAAYAVPIYQVTRAFRDDESGQFHNPEFSMLEWYRPGFDMFQLVDELESLIGYLHAQAGLALEGPFRRISYHDAFQSILQINPHVATAGQLHALAMESGIDVPEGMNSDPDNRDAWLDWMLTQAVIPGLADAAQPWLFLYDYPSSQAALAQIGSDDYQNTVARRFELFCGGLELANGYHELTDAGEQRRRFELDNTARFEAGLEVMPLDENLVQAMDAGLPASAGVALGLDRLLMALWQHEQIDDVISFSFDIA